MSGFAMADDHEDNQPVEAKEVLVPYSSLRDATMTDHGDTVRPTDITWAGRTRTATIATVLLARR